jgi:hypothetical protein
MKLRIATLCAAAMFALLSVNATAQRAVTVYSGATDVTLSSSLLTSLTSLNVKVGYDHPAMVSGATATFPLVTGVIDLSTSAGSLLHSGTLIFDAQSDATRVRLQAFVISTASKPPVLSAEVVVNNAVWGRYNVFDLTLPAGTTLPLKPSGNTQQGLRSLAVHPRLRCRHRQRHSQRRQQPVKNTIFRVTLLGCVPILESPLIQGWEPSSSHPSHHLAFTSWRISSHRQTAAGCPSLP